MRKIILMIVISISILIFLIGCSNKIYKIAYPTLNDGKYDSEFPYKNCSKELAQIVETVRKVYCNTNYNHHIFSYDKKLRYEQINNAILEDADDIKYIKNTVTGTGTIIYSSGRNLAVLSCAHIFDKPDTIFTYYYDENNVKTKYLQSVSIKKMQENLVYGIPEKGDFEILLMDRENDVAILSKRFNTLPDFITPVMNYPFGKAKELEWGSFVYLVGYPKGYKIVTKGIVSHPNRDKKGSFLIDALFNTGLSGGILLAIRDGVPNFEFVGITTSAAAELSSVLIPEHKWEYDESIPYDGKIYVDTKKSITYGITRAISSELILNLINQNREFLVNQGFDFKFLFTAEIKK